MHARIDRHKTDETRRGVSHTPNDKTNIRIQYILSAFNESLEYANHYFIAIYLEKGSEAAWQLYADWFEKREERQRVINGYFL